MQNTLSAALPLDEQPLVAPDFSTPASSLLTYPCIARAADAQTLSFPGESATMLLPSVKTAGRVTVGSLEATVGGGPPPHAHGAEDEIMLVQSGKFEFFCNGQFVEVQPGDVIYLAREEAHRFRGLDSGESNRFNIMVAPGGFEHFFARWAPMMQNGAPDPADAAALCGEYGITVYPCEEAAPVVANQKSKIVRSGSAPVLDVLGNDVTVLLRADDTQGRYSLVRVEGPRDSGPPLHIHEREDELFLVEAGSVEFTLGTEKVTAHAGDVVWAPRGFQHTFRIDAEYARMAVLMNPGGFEGFFVNCNAMEAAGTLNPPAAIAVGAQFGLTFVPPVA